MKKLEINGINFDLPERYESIKLIGKGTYGAVISAIDNGSKDKEKGNRDLIRDLISYSRNQEAWKNRRYGNFALLCDLIIM